MAYHSVGMYQTIVELESAGLGLQLVSKLGKSARRAEQALKACRRVEKGKGKDLRCETGLAASNMLSLYSKSRRFRRPLGAIVGNWEVGRLGGGQHENTKDGGVGLVRRWHVTRRGQPPTLQPQKADEFGPEISRLQSCSLRRNPHDIL
jgi:hypothetical protein